MSTFSKCDLQVNNMCEAFNKTIMEYRDKSIIEMTEGIRMYVMKRFIKMWDRVSWYCGKICSKMVQILGKPRKKINLWMLEWVEDV